MNVESKNEMFLHKSCTIKASCDRCKGPGLLTPQPGGSVLIHCPKCNPELNEPKVKEPKHSVLPWTQDDSQIICRENKMLFHVAKCHDAAGYEGVKATTNAALIVESVNTLAKLKPAVEELLQAVRRGWSWQNDEIRERCEAVRYILGLTGDWKRP